MEIYFILLIIVLLIIIAFIVWSVRLVLMYRKGRKGWSFYLQSTALASICVFITWQLQIFPLSKNFYIKDQTQRLTGISFWSWEEFSIDDWGVRGEGYTIDIYRFNDVTAKYFTNPPETFYSYPLEAKVKWTPTPVQEKDKDSFLFATPSYGGWSQDKIDKMKFVRNLGFEKGSYYAYNPISDIDFYLINPSRKLIVIINHNM
jgi:hypothetical protein